MISAIRYMRLKSQSTRSKRKVYVQHVQVAMKGLLGLILNGLMRLGAENTS